MVPRTKLIQALERVRNRETGYPSIVQTVEINRSDRELLLKTGWLREIIKGWYLFVRPDAPNKDSTVWYAHFWEFLAIYLEKHYQEDYCLSAEASLDVLLQKPITPKQLVIITKKGGGGAPRLLPYETSLLIYSDPKNIPVEKITIQNLQVMTLPLALCRVAPIFFKNYPIDAEIALKSIKLSAELSQIILKYDFKKAADRLVGAYQFLNLENMAIQLRTELEAFGMKIVPENPFSPAQSPLLKTHRLVSPYAGRIEAMWAKFRTPIIDVFPKSPGEIEGQEKYFRHIDSIYKEDAYHSLSIEGFVVTPELIERVKNNQWDPDVYLNDRDLRNALAARGYYEAFLSVKKTLYEILESKKNPGTIIEYQLQKWFRALFAPSVRAGIVSETDLLGYRHHRVHIRNSRHVPPPPEAVIDSMETFFQCLKSETHPAVRVILGHYLFVFIHPYMDGNGRIGRFIMNAMLAAGGYSWVIVPVNERELYMNSLEIAGTDNNIVPFANLIAKLLAEQESKKS